MKLDKEDLIRINKGFGGLLRNDASIDFALEQQENTKLGEYKKLAYLIRAILVDHPFSDGNKRTAITIVLTEFQEEGIKVDKYALQRTMVNLSKTGEGDLNKIERKLRRCTRK